LWEEVCTVLIENWNGLAPEEKKKQNWRQLSLF
jgi:hypothetical protein